MKNFFYLKVLSFACVFAATSCSSSDDKGTNFINTSSDITISSLGGSEKIETSTTDFSVVSIINKDDNTTIKGNVKIGSEEGDVQTEYDDIALSLLSTQFGTMKADVGEHKGFSIQRYHGKTLTLTLKPNYTLSPFKFVIVLKSGETTNEINVTQEASNRYKFKSISYSMGDGDGISAPYWYSVNSDIQQGSATDKDYQLPTKRFMTSFIFDNGGDYSAAFSSDDDGAFGWPTIDDNAPDIKVPINVVDGKLVYADKTIEYSDVKNKVLLATPFPDEITVKLSRGINNFRIKVEMVKLVSTYTMTITDSKTGADRQLKGKVTLIQPTGKYEITNVVNL